MSTKRPRIPSYRLHKPSGQARVILDGEHIYLGKYGTPKSWEKYHRVVAQRLKGADASAPARLCDESRQPNPTVDELILAYWRFAQGYYVKNGEPTGETDNVRGALRPLRRLYGSTEAKHFGPDDLEVVRQSMIDADLSRKVINGRVSRIKRMFRWASKKRFVPPQTYHGLKAVVREAVKGEPWLFLQGLYRAEVGLAQSVHRIASARPHPLPPIDMEKAIGWVEGRLKINLSDGQRQAVRQACQKKFLVITGGPGVGKTTLVRSILEVFTAKRLKCVLAAPTGRAAKRLAETTERTAKTVHRLLEFDPATDEFKRNQENPLKGDLFVLDEVSMVDVVLGHQFFRAVPTAASVILAGDVDQLPSVGPGSVLADLIASGVVPVVRLTEIFRQAAESQIVTAAYAINQGRMPNLATPEGLSDFYFIEAQEPEAVQDLVLRLVKERIPARFGFDSKTDIQVLSPMNRSMLGARNLNQVLQQALNPGDGGPAVQRFGWTYRIGDRVIQTENDYNRDVFNGDLGVIEKINRIDQEMVVSFEGRQVEYDFGDLDELSLAYVLSIHKSQGSEFPCVVIPLHTQHYMMLRRNLLYTAVTRGKRLVVLVGTKKALGMAVRRQDTGLRHTALRRRLEGRKG